MCQKNHKNHKKNTYNNTLCNHHLFFICIFWLMMITWARLNHSLNCMIFFYGNTSLKNLAFIDSILVLRWISSILDLCTRNRYALLLYTYATNTQSTVLYHILTFLRSSISTFTRHPHTLRYMLEGLLPLHNLYGVFSNFVRSTLLSI
jgi:hypothetical protein